MKVQRRVFMAGVAASGLIRVVPSYAEDMSDTFEFEGGTVTVHPVAHASFALETPQGVIYVDPVGGGELFEDLPKADIVLVTHQHGDHFDVPTLEAVVGENTRLITNTDVAAKIEGMLEGKAEVIGYEDKLDLNGIELSAIPSYNLTEDRLNFHPKERGDNGYVLDLGGFRIYISGDTEDVPEMRALENIDLAFLCMNLPCTMTAEQAASAVAEFKPKFVYPYHWNGRDGGTQDPEVFAELVGDTAEVRIAEWYAE